MRRISCILLALNVIITSICGCKSEKATFVTIGTGGVTGLYYPTGGALSRMLNKRSAEFKIKATVESTSGSVFNINAVLLQPENIIRMFFPNYALPLKNIILLLDK